MSNASILDIVSLVARMAVIVADIIVLVATWYRAVGTFRDSRRLGIKVPLYEILLRDGLCTSSLCDESECSPGVVVLGTLFFLCV